ncbi:MAG TPA: PDDEXK nuclease domain-containing protein [Burkholderiaceae bacterium]
MIKRKTDHALVQRRGARAVSFTQLVGAVTQTHDRFIVLAGKAVNISLTLRNWVIGGYIQQYEQRGADRAEYGERLLDRLSATLQGQGMPRMSARELRRYRLLFQRYPAMWESLTPELKNQLPAPATPVDSIRESVTPGSPILPTRALVENLSFTHFVELLAVPNPLQRTFYELECLRGNWSVRELKRQIASLLYERVGLSTDRKRLLGHARDAAEVSLPRHIIRDPYVFEFLGLKSSEVMTESILEDQLLDRLQSFLLEMGDGFCFEARQKRILIGDSHGFVDLVFYHRILKCHVLVELKLAAFNHQNIGQLNTYVNWYGKHMRSDGDGPPIGILLCTHKDHALVEYALAGMDNRLFVSRYQLELPKKEEMQRFLEAQISRLDESPARAG